MTPAALQSVSIARRRVLDCVAAGASALCLPRAAWSQPRVVGDLFSLGVASGSPDHASVVLWTRLARPGVTGGGMGSAPVTVRWEVAHDEAFAQIVRSGESEAVAALAHSVHVEPSGLAPDRWYFYRFMAGESVSPTGRTRTFPLPDSPAGRLRLAYASCQRWEHGYFGAYRHMREENLDAVVFLGDYIYEYPGAAHAVRPSSGGWAQGLDSYRARYAQYKADLDLQAMHAACPWLVTWDDHEVQNDYAGLHEGNSGGPTPDFAARRAAAYQAFYEHMPVRASVWTRALSSLGSGSDMRLYSQVRFGKLASIYLLDGRQYKDRQACPPTEGRGSTTLDPATCDTWKDPTRTLLGNPQERWFDDRLAANKDAHWNIIGQQTLFGQRDFRPGPQRFFWNDGWDGYPAARTRLTDSLRRHGAANPVMLGGDIHENWVGHLKADYALRRSPAIGVEFCGTSLTSRSSVGNDKLPARLAENPHFVFADAVGKGYGVVEFTPGALSTTLRVVDDVTRRDTGVSTLAKFVVQAGRPVLQRA